MTAITYSRYENVSLLNQCCCLIKAESAAYWVIRGSSTWNKPLCLNSRWCQARMHCSLGHPTSLAVPSSTSLYAAILPKYPLEGDGIDWQTAGGLRTLIAKLLVRCGRSIVECELCRGNSRMVYSAAGERRPVQEISVRKLCCIDTYISFLNYDASHGTSATASPYCNQIASSRRHQYYEHPALVCKLSSFNAWGEK